MNYLLEKGADPNVKNNAGSTPLHKGAVAKYEQLQILRVLIEKKADPLIRNASGLLPEQLAPGDLVIIIYITFIYFVSISLNIFSRSSFNSYPHTLYINIYE